MRDQRIIRSRRLLLLFVVFVLVLTQSVYAFGDSDSSIQAEKNEFYFGDPVNIIATGSGDSWVGIYPKEWIDDPMTHIYNPGEVSDGGNGGYMSVYWYYVKDHNGVPFNVKQGENNFSNSKCSPYAGLPEGSYYAVLFDASETYKIDKYIEFTVKPNPNASQEYSLRMENDKTVFGPGEPVNVIATGPGDAWVGLYPASQSTYTGDPPSVTWYWVSSANGAVKDLRADTAISTGEYKVILFRDSGYDVWGEPIYITIVDVDTSGTNFTLKLNEGSNYGGGYSPSETIKTTVTADGEMGNSWLGIYAGQFDMNTNFGSMRSIYWYFIEDYNGVEVDLVNEAFRNNDKYEFFGLPVGDYTIVVFGDSGYNDKRILVNVRKDKEIKDIVIEKEPTCRTMGRRVIYYTDGTSSEDEDPGSSLIPALGHQWGSFTYDEATRTHKAVCERDPSHVKTEKCSFGAGTVIEELTISHPGRKEYTCKVCGGKYIEIIEPKEGDVFSSSKATYTITSSTEAEFTKSLASATAKSVSVPATVKIAGKDYKVTSVGDEAFADQKKAIVTLGANVKTTPKTATYKGGTGTKLGAYKITGTKTASFVVSKAAKTKKSLAVPTTVKLGAKTYNVNKVLGNAFSGYKKLTSVTIGANVATLSAKAFAGAPKLKTVTLKTKKLKQANVKNCLKSSKVTTIKVKVGTKAINKTYVKKYKKIFTKAIAGKAAAVK